MNLYFGSRVASLEILGERGDGLERLENTALAIVAQGRHRGVELVDHVGVSAVGMEREMSGTSSPSNRHRRGVIGSQGSHGLVVAVDEELIEAKIGDDRKAVGGVEVDRVGVGPFLAVPIGAGSLVLHES